jgi:probable phosphoglycerate mutase
VLVVVLGIIGVLSLAIIGAGIVDVVRGNPVAAVDVACRANRIVLVRHGQTEWSESGRHTSVTEVELTDEGQLQSSALAEALSGWRFDEIYVSPRRRARDTLALLKRPEPSTVLDELAEWDYGDDEGRTTAEIRETRPGWTIWGEGPAGGETITEVAARCRRVLRRVDGDVLLVAHGHVLRVLAACWLGLDPSDGRSLALDPGTLSVLGREREQPVLTTWNAPA